MRKPRPPDILRKSHAHTEGKLRARERRALRDELASAGADTDAALLIDLDGVIYQGDDVVEGAVDAIEWLGDQALDYLYVTNTTSRPRSDIVDKLAELGIASDAEQILTPPVAATKWLRDNEIHRVALYVPEATVAEFSEFDAVDPDDDAAAPDAIVIGDYGANWTFDRLNRAFRGLMTDARPRLIALGMTRYWRAPDGLRLDTAPFVVALAHAAGVDPIVIGKPSEQFFAAAVAHLNVPANRVWIIGDDIRTDIEGGQHAGFKGILVRTGKFRQADLAAGIDPELVLDAIADLPHLWSPDVLHRRRESR